MATLSYTSAGLATMAGASDTVVSVTTQTNSANRWGCDLRTGLVYAASNNDLGA